MPYTNSLDGNIDFESEGFNNREKWKSFKNEIFTQIKTHLPDARGCLRAKNHFLEETSKLY